MICVYIYIYGTPPKTYVHLTFAGICNMLCLFLAAFWTLVFVVPYVYIYIVHARRLHDLFVHFGRNAFRMRSMHSECILDQNQDPRSKIPTRLLAKILEKPRSKIQDSHKTPG